LTIKVGQFQFRLGVWTCVHVFFALAVAFMILRGNYEERLYARLVEYVRQPGMSRQDLAIALVRKVHELVKPRAEIWSEPVGGPYDVLFRSSGDELNVPDRACGSYALVLLKSLKTAGYHVRCAQMTTTTGPAGHILVEAEIEPGQWAVLDSTFELYLKRSDGRLASFADVRAKFDYYRPQLPQDWPGEYQFQDVRYTNWAKVPILMPAIRHVLAWFMPEEIKTLSIRAIFTNVSYVYAAVVASVYVMLLIARTIVRRSRAAATRRRESRAAALEQNVLGRPALSGTRVM
jgi:hypothetical protein